MRSTRIINPKQPTELKQLKTSKPKGSQVQAAGVCYSDIHSLEGGYEGAEGQFLKTTDGRRRGRLVLVGLFGGALQLNLITVPTRTYRLIRAYTGNMIEMAQLVSLAKRGMIKPLISDIFKLDQATGALSKLKDGKINGRGIIKP